MGNKWKYWRVVGLILLVIIIPIMGFTLINIMLDNSSAEVKDIKEKLEGNITLVSNRTDKREELTSLVNEFEKINPKVKVNLELIGDAEGILQRKASVGELPDVTLVPSAITTSEYKEYFLPIDELGFKDEDIYNYNTGLGSDGELYTLSTSIAWQGVIYNKKIFDEAGIDKLPKTKDELLNICEKIKNIGYIPMVLNYKQAWTMNMWLDIAPYALDPNLENDVVRESEDILAENNGMHQSLEFARTIVEKGYCEEDLLNYDWQQCKIDMANGKIAMMFWNSDFLYQLEDMGMHLEELGMFPFPESKIIRVAGDYKFAIAKNSTYPDAAKALLKFMYEDDRYFNAVNIMSPIKTNEDNIKLLNNLKNFNIPIEIEGDIAKTQSKEAEETHDIFYDARKSTALDAYYVQDYITSTDRVSFRESMNEKWKEYLSKSKE